MSYAGMPDMITPSMSSKAIAFWLAARFYAAIALFAAVVIGWRPFNTYRSCQRIAQFSVAYTMAAYLLILFYPALIPETYTVASGLSTFKIIAEYVIVLIHISSAVLLFLWMGTRMPDNHFSRNLFIALCIMALSEVCFTLYSSISDTYNLLGHLYKIVAYFFLYRAVFMVSVKTPFETLQQSQNLLYIEKELAQITLNSIGDAIITTNFDGNIIMLNPVAEMLTGWQQQEAAGKPLHEVFHTLHQMTRTPMQQLAYQAIHNSDTAEPEQNKHAILISRNQHEYAIEYSATPIRNSAGYTLGCVLIFHNTTEKTQLIEQISWQAGHDTLTKLPNRTLLSDRITQAIAHAQLQEQLLLVCFMDLDGFKAVNDQHGHETGDKLLIEVARRLTQVVRSDDTVSRLGGDEFVLLLSELNSADEADILISRILDEMARTFQIEQKTLKISASIGATIFPFDSSDTDSLLRHADQAMYQAKQSGRNRFHLFDASMDQQLHEHHQKVARLELALAQNELRLHFQPKVNLKTSCIIGMEALLRWQHPEQGLLAPAEFLHLAEESNLIVDIGNWVLNEALRQAEKWHEAGHAWVVSVNIAARQLQCYDFMENIQSILQQHPGVSPRQLEFEILESTALQDMSHVSTMILACQKLGISVSLDDFGSGYSSLAYLRNLPVNTLKIDQSFVRDMLDDEEDCALVEGILQLARVFKREVIAEGMETAAHGSLLLKLGCNIAQGYGIARPMPAEQVLDWAAQFKPDPSWQNYSAVLVGWGRNSIDKASNQSELSI
jgi:diguanylate cyclase (GGDEF)-like protein/PAS domain S-box-containing protein